MSTRGNGVKYSESGTISKEVALSLNNLKKDQDEHID